MELTLLMHAEYLLPGCVDFWFWFLCVIIKEIKENRLFLKHVFSSLWNFDLKPFAFHFTLYLFHSSHPSIHTLLLFIDTLAAVATLPLSSDPSWNSFLFVSSVFCIAFLLLFSCRLVIMSYIIHRHTIMICQGLRSYCKVLFLLISIGAIQGVRS